MRQFAVFEKNLEPDETPFVSALPKGCVPWAVPDFCAKTKKQVVEPFFEYYTEIVDILAGVSPDQDEEDWGTWVPSAHHTRLSKLANRIGQLAYQEIENPSYNEAQCLAWKEENMQSWTKIEWGTSDLARIGTPEIPSNEPSDVGG